MSYYSITDKDFKKLPISTQAVMSYFNCTFNIKNIKIIFAEKFTEIVNNKGIIKSGKKPVIGGIYQTNNGTVKIKNNIGKPAGRNAFKENQIAYKIYIIDKFITIKIFRTGKIHMTGCKTREHYIKTAITLFNIIKNFSKPNFQTYCPENPNEPISIIFEKLMINVGFNINFPFDLIELDKLIQEKGHDKKIYSTYETTANNCVNIKIEYPDPKIKNFDKLTLIPNKNGEYDIETSFTDYCNKIKKKDTHEQTFMVFSSSKVILSGKFYDTQMQDAYNKIIEFMTKYRSRLEIKIDKNTKFDIHKLKGIDPLTCIPLKKKEKTKKHDCDEKNNELDEKIDNKIDNKVHKKMNKKCENKNNNKVNKKIDKHCDNKIDKKK